MSYKVIAIPSFEKELKNLAKKYPSLKFDLAHLTDTLTNEPNTGTPLGKGIYKIRLAIASKGKGKSGGARVVTYVKVVAETVYLLAIYDKSDIDTLTNNEIIKRLGELP